MDPLKETMLVFYVDAEQRHCVDAEFALRQIDEYLRSSLSERLRRSELDRRAEALT